MDRHPVPEAVRRAARALGLAADQLRPLPGASGETWASEPGVLRVRPSVSLRRELAASAAAGAAVPVPRVLDVVDLDPPGEVSAALLQWVPGRPAGNLDGVDRRRAAAIGRVCGEIHAALATVPAPGGLRSADGQAAPNDRLLHLDLHPFNILLDDRDQVSGVVDWANCAAGPPELDRARTATLFHWDPAAVVLKPNPVWAALAEAWAATASFPQIPRRALLWAYRYMLADLSDRYHGDELSELRRAADEFSRY
ncbi:MAG TPA: phosphotransferase [Acidimicrobiales bacterium]|nr:phosphotransferase [Acidimicrobiales bacterium]